MNAGDHEREHYVESLTFPERVAGGSTTASLGAFEEDEACADEVLALPFEAQLRPVVPTTSNSSSSSATVVVELALEQVLRPNT